MKFIAVSLFPQIFENYFSSSIMAKNIEEGNISYELVDIRDFAVGKYRSCDDYPYGGGAGMILTPEPLSRALDSIYTDAMHVIYPSPVAPRFTQSRAQELSEKEEIVLICGRYEGIDQRIIDLYVDETISIGDYVLSSGEIAAITIIDTVYRLCKGVINSTSLIEESYSGGLLEYPHYTRPSEFQGHKVPEVLLSGDHEKIRQWRKEQSLIRTKKYRRDMYEQYKDS